MNALAAAIEGATTLLALCGLAYYMVALWSARDFIRPGVAVVGTPSPGVSILKPMKGIEPGMYASVASHCKQDYAGEYEIVFGVGSTDDAVVPALHQLQAEFPEVRIRIVECPLRLGTSGKVSNLAQMLPHAAHRHLLINDSDILVSPNYLANIMRGFAPSSSGHEIGMVTAPYIGHTGAGGALQGVGARDMRATVWSKLEALGIATDFIPGVLTARKIEGGIRFGLGSTLAFTREALDAAGGLAPLAEYLADDYELGARIAAKGYEIVLSKEVVATAIPAYSFRGFWEHQLRWARSTRDSRRLGYLGLVFTFGLPWAMLNCVSSGFALWSFSLLSVLLLARVAVALNVGVGILRDEQVLRDLWLLPLRDLLALLLWAWSYADDTVVWRGEKFRLRNGKLVQM